MNNFKRINDRFGHTTGDKIITTFTTTFQKKIRTTDSFGRWGGDEFLLICPGIGSKGAEALIDRAYNSILDRLHEIVPHVSFCYGSAEYSKGSTWSDLVVRADKNLYISKKKLNATD